MWNYFILSIYLCYHLNLYFTKILFDMNILIQLYEDVFVHFYFGNMLVNVDHVNYHMTFTYKIMSINLSHIYIYFFFKDKTYSGSVIDVFTSSLKCTSFAFLMLIKCSLLSFLCSYIHKQVKKNI